jgi:hypothetical protein
MSDPEEDIGAGPVNESSQFKDKIFSKIEREISEEDLRNPGVIRLIIADNEKLIERIENLEIIERNYYQEQKILGRLEEKENKRISYEVLYDSTIALGGILAGLSTYDFAKALSINNIFMLILAGIFIAGSLFSKWVKK